MAGRILRWLVVPTIAAAGACALLHWPVRTRQGVNYRVTEQTLPLYLKATRFLYRDLEYRALVRPIVAGAAGDEARLLRLYEWVRGHLRHGVPEGLPVVDDHVWHIIVRGYGTSDQLADVLATLCVYAGIPAQLAFLGPPGEPPVHAITMVKLGQAWYPVDPSYGVIVRHADGRLATREELVKQPELLRRATAGLHVREIAYGELYRWLPEIKPGTALRPYWHQPFARAWYELRRGVRGLAAFSWI